MEISADKWEVPFAAERDSISLLPHTRHVLDELDYQPRMWSLMSNLTCTMYFPRSIKSG